MGQGKTRQQKFPEISRFFNSPLRCSLNESRNRRISIFKIPRIAIHQFGGNDVFTSVQFGSQLGDVARHPIGKIVLLTELFY